MRRAILLLVVTACPGCHRATVSDVGAHERIDAFQMATMAAAERGASVNPGAVGTAAKGAAIRQAPGQ